MLRPFQSCVAALLALASSLTARGLLAQERAEQQEDDEEEYSAVAEVEAPPREPTRRSIEGAELTEVPGTRGDPLRAIEIMPGVGRTPSSDGTPLLRGASGSESLTFLDGMPIPNLFHFGGLTSVVHPRLVERVDVYPGNFSVRYGRAVGGIIEARLRDPRTDGQHAIGEISVVDSSLLLETELGDDGGIVLAGRRSNIDLFFESAVGEEDFGVVAAPVYYDYQGIAAYQLGRHRVELYGYGASDGIELLLPDAADADPGMRGAVKGSLVSHQIGLRLESRLSDVLTQESHVALGYASFAQNMGGTTMDMDSYTVNARSEWRAVLSKMVSVTAGLDVATQHVTTAYRGPRAPQLEGDPTTRSDGDGNQRTVNVAPRGTMIVNPAGYLEIGIRPTEDWHLIPGVRVDYFGLLDAWSVDPRFAARYTVSDSLTLKAGAGLFSQPTPNYWEALEDIGNPDLEPQRAVQLSAGTEHTLGRVVAIGIEGFYKHLFDRVVATERRDAPWFENDGTGNIYGVDFSVIARPTPRTVGTIAYTLSRSERADHGDPTRLFDRDQPHVLAIAASHAFENGITVGARFRLVSGNPSTPIVGSFFDARTGLYRPLFGPINSERIATFHQLDARIEKTWKFELWSLSAYLDLQNAYNAQNEEGRLYSYDFSKSDVVKGLPILPNLGLRGEL